MVGIFPVFFFNILLCVGKRTKLISTHYMYRGREEIFIENAF